MRRIILLVATTLFLAPAAGAVEGVLEINQACAVNTGCLTGDTAGFPVQIPTSGSYILTSNLVVPDENTTAIEVVTASVGIDLNNFEIVRLGCVNAISPCTPPPGSGYGITFVSETKFTWRGISVKNGGITGMGSGGVFLSDQAEVANLRVRWNAAAGIAAGSGSSVSENLSYQNGSAGIVVGAGARVSGNTVYGNGSDGIWAALGSMISNNLVYDNTGRGIECWDEVPTGSGVSGNVIIGNGCTFNDNCVDAGGNVRDSDTSCP